MHVCQQTCKALVTLLGRHLVVVVSRKVQVNSCVTGCWSHVLDTVPGGNAPEDLQRRHIMRLCGARLCQKRAKEDWRLFRPSLGMAVSDSSSPFCSERCMQFHSLLLLLSTEHSAVISSPLTALYGNEAVQLTTADV